MCVIQRILALRGRPALGVHVVEELATALSARTWFQTDHFFDPERGRRNTVQGRWDLTLAEKELRQ